MHLSFSAPVMSSVLYTLVPGSCLDHVQHALGDPVVPDGRDMPFVNPQQSLVLIKDMRQRVEVRIVRRGPFEIVIHRGQQLGQPARGPPALMALAAACPTAVRAHPLAQAHAPCSGQSARPRSAVHHGLGRQIDHRGPDRPMMVPVAVGLFDRHPPGILCHRLRDRRRGGEQHPGWA